MRLSQLTITQRILASAGAVVVLVLLAATVLYLWLQHQASARIARELSEAPRGWADSLRAMGRVPDLTGLALARSDTGDGSAMLYDSTRAWRHGDLSHALRALVGDSVTATAADSVAWREVTADTGLDRFVAAARLTRWNALQRSLAGSAPAAEHNLLLIMIPRFVPIRNATRGLVIRGLMRLRRGDRAGARTDLSASLGLGEQMARREPGLIGTLIGRAVIASAARGWERYAAGTGDAGLEARAKAVRAWASVRPGPYVQMLANAPDTALAVARDTALTLGVRAEGLSATIFAWYYQPRGFVFGPPARMRNGARALAADHDPDLARLATITANNADRLRFFGFLKMEKEANTVSR